MQLRLNAGLWLRIYVHRFSLPGEVLNAGFLLDNKCTHIQLTCPSGEVLNAGLCFRIEVQRFSMPINPSSSSNPCLVS